MIWLQLPCVVFTYSLNFRRLYRQPITPVTVSAAGGCAACRSHRDGTSNKASGDWKDRILRHLRPQRRYGLRPRSSADCVAGRAGPLEEFVCAAPASETGGRTRWYRARTTRRCRGRARTPDPGDTPGRSLDAIHARRDRRRMCAALWELRPGTTGRSRVHSGRVFSCARSSLLVSCAWCSSSRRRIS